LDILILNPAGVYMRKLLYISVILILFFNKTEAQNVTGIVTDSNGVRLEGIKIELYSLSQLIKTVSNSFGEFTLNITTGVNESLLPKGYFVSNNYPNPFNPKTRIDFSLPKTSSIKVELFNLTGQRVRDLKEKNMESGISHIDIELSGLPNGIYFAHILIDGKFSVTKKLMLLYGSQHLNAAVIMQTGEIGKASKDIFIDSILLTSQYIQKTKINAPAYNQGDVLNLGKVKVKKNPSPEFSPCPDLPSVYYAGKTYHTLQIGNQCWFKENLDVGVMINSGQNSADNHIFEKYCYNNDIENCTAYGGLYRWEEAVQYSPAGDLVKGICPEGWHIPSLKEFQVLIGSTGTKNVNFMQTGQAYGTDSTGFSALLGGVLEAGGYVFSHFGINGYYWSSNEDSHIYAAFLFVGRYDAYVFTKFDNKGYSLSVRCLRNY
jgi:uncharacterized protein (TIGR02145 family)